MSRLRRMPLGLVALLGTIAVLQFAGCSKNSISGELQMFKNSGRAVSEFSDLDPGPLGARKCQTGTIDSIATLLCEYSSTDAASQGQTAAEGWFSQTSAALVLRRNQLLLGLSDRNNTDPSGKTMSMIAKIFRRVGKS